MSDVIDPIELLTNKGNRQPNCLNQIWNPFFCGALGFLAAVVSKWATRKPIFSGVQTHIFLTTLGTGVGYFVDGKRNEYLAKRDAILRHYVELHPEDFPPKPRKKYGDVLERWVPIR